MNENSATRNENIDADNGTTVDLILDREGIGEEIECAVRELLLNVDQSGLNEKTHHDAQQEETVFAMNFLRSVLGEKAGAVSDLDRAVRLIKSCSPRALPDVVYDNAAEAFMLLISKSPFKNKSSTNLPGIPAPEFNSFFRAVCKDLPSSCRKLLLGVVELESRSKGSEDGLDTQQQTYLVSFNDFMCSILVYFTAREFVDSIRAEFFQLDEDEDGLISLKAALDLVNRIDWSVPEDRRNNFKDLCVSRPVPEGTWLGKAQRITAPLKPCPVGAIRVEDRVATAIKRLEKVERYDTLGDDGTMISCCDLVDILTETVSPLAQYSSSWLLS